jgi:hypothetical protein
MKCGFPKWPTWQTYFAISVSLIIAYRVSALHHSHSMTKQKLSEKNLFRYQRSRKWTSEFLTICGQFHQWKWNSAEPLIGSQHKGTLSELKCRLHGVLTIKSDIRILDQGSLFYWRYPTRIDNNEWERWTDTDKAFLWWKSPTNVQEDGFESFGWQDKSTIHSFLIKL